MHTGCLRLYFEPTNICKTSANFLIKDITSIQINELRGVCIITTPRGHGGRVVTLSPPTSETGVSFPARPQVGKLIVACRWLAVYSTEP